MIMPTSQFTNAENSLVSPDPLSARRVPKVTPPLKILHPPLGAPYKADYGMV